jgi:hypothetical protein
MKDRKNTKCLQQQQQQHMKGADGWLWILFLCVSNSEKLQTN